MGSMLLRASRDLFCAARKVALAGRWAAPVTVARSDLRGRLSFHSGIDGNTPRSTYAPPDELPVPEDILLSDKDLESDESLWALYGRWCKSLNQQRDYDEMVRRFDKFKETVRIVDSVNKAKLPYTLKLSQFADGKLEESMVLKVCGEGSHRLDPATLGKGEVFFYENGDDVRAHPRTRFKFSESHGHIIPLE